MPAKYRFEVSAYGCDFRIETSRQEDDDVLRRYVFPSWPRREQFDERSGLTIRVHPMGAQVEMAVAEVSVATAGSINDLMPELTRVIDEAVIQQLKNLYAVHAGAVAWRNSVLLLPGGTHAGKSSLVAELLRHGATYFSDEYALIDPEGRVHPYPRALLVRGDNSQQSPLLASELNAATGEAPAPVGWIVALQYRSDCAWSLTPVAQSEGLLTLLRNTPHIMEESPGLLGAFTRSVGGAVCYAGSRGEAGEAAGRLLQLFDQGT